VNVLPGTAADAPSLELVPNVWDTPAGDLAVSSGSWGRQVAGRLVTNPRAVAGLTVLLAVTVLAAAAPLIARYNPDAINPLALNQLPSGGHWFGTDYLGRDLWSRVLFGARVSLPIGLGVVAIEFVIGVPLGLVAGYAGKLIDELLMRLVDVKLALPGLLLPLGVIAVLGPSMKSMVLALGIAGAPGYARMARGTTLKVCRQEYMEAARAIGRSNRYVVLRHVLPNILDPLIVQATTGLGVAIIAASALSYLGLGVQPPTADWGSLLNSGYENMFEAWSEVAFPGLAVCLTVLGINLFGDGLADAMNPRL